MKNILKYLDIKEYSKERRNQFIFNVILGLAVLFLFVLLRNSAVRQNFINTYFDYFIKFRLDSDTNTKKVSQEIIFLDFDDTSLYELERPSITPRNKVAELVELAYIGGAKIIILDMDFSEPDYSPEKILSGDILAMDGQSRDRTLFELFEKIKADSDSQAKVLLPVTAYSDRTLKNNVFHSLIDNQKIFEVTPTFTTSKFADSSVRFWMPYMEVREDLQAPIKILWSIPLLTCVLAYGDFNELQNLESKIIDSETDVFTIHITRDDKAEEFHFYKEYSDNGDLIRDSSAQQYNRIQYVMIPPDVNLQLPFGNISESKIGHWRKTGVDNKRVDFKDKIVIIGRADKDCGDFFRTSVGNLPGMYIHGNSIATIMGKTQPHLTSPYKHVFIEIFLIFIAAYGFLWLSPFKAKCLIIVLTALCWIFTYVYFCFTNEFIYLSFAFTAVGVYNFVNNIQAFIVGGVSIRGLLRRR